ncbi:MAG: hypothetical protein JWM80_5011 [Cyanobacteria bacterium RYN_339]|nr:hypothetical protein [Cyanobacteria bacterium RYN_339]
MKFESGKFAIIGAGLALLGCSAGVPALTTQAQAPASAPAQGGYQVQALEDVPDAGSVIDQLPARISLADAAKMLVSVDQAEVRTGGTYALQAWGTYHGRNMDNHTTNNNNNNNNTTFRTRSNDNDNNRDHNRSRRDSSTFNNSFLFNRSYVNYYPYGSYYFPYYNTGSYYSPYTTNCTQPYLYRYGGLFAPYNYPITSAAPCTSLLTAPGLIPTVNNY